MAMKLDDVVPWGRSLDEYRQMFMLSDVDLEKQIVGCGDGPASFNAELTARGGSVISIDPLYAYGADEIRQRFDETLDLVLDQVRSTPDRWVWTYHKDVEDLKQNRIRAMERFSQDLEAGKHQGRYLVGGFPSVPFEDNSFDLALCSHFLFLYSEHFDQEFHIQSLKEMCRVAGEARVFPILDLQQRTSAHLDCVMDSLAQAGCKCEIQEVSYELQRGGNKMLRAWS